MALKSLALITLALVLPHGQHATLELTKQDAGKLVAYSRGDLFEGREAQAWLNAMSGVLETAYSNYATLYRDAKTLSHCKEPAPELPNLAFIFVGDGRFASPDGDREGFNHPDNPGPLIEADRWQDSSVKTLMVHEAVHRWCGAENETENERWLEEGAADFVAYQTTGEPPQLSITRYFADSSRANLYGSSFLWYLARSLAPAGHSEDIVRLLAAFHLGLRPDLFFGRAAPLAMLGKSDFPYGAVLKSCPADTPCVNFWRTPWGMIELEPFRDEAPAGAFVWRLPPEFHLP